MGSQVPDASIQNVFLSILDCCDNFLFDCDGVLWQANTALQGAVETVNLLQKLGKKVLFITNNSTKTRHEYLEKLSKLGFSATADDIFGSAYTSALYLKHVHKITGKVYVVGNESMGKELSNVGINHFGIGPDYDIVYHSQIPNCKLEKDVEAVLVGFDGNISFTKMLKAASYLGDPNCLYVASNDDQRMAMKGTNFVVPGTGCMVNSVTTAAGRKPDVICGKPGSYMFKCIQKELNLIPERSIMIGDRMNTDILFGKTNNLKTLLVFTGIESHESLTKVINSKDCELKKQLPDYCMSSIGKWVPLLKNV